MTTTRSRTASFSFVDTKPEFQNAHVGVFSQRATARRGRKSHLVHYVAWWRSEDSPSPVSRFHAGETAKPLYVLPHLRGAAPMRPSLHAEPLDCSRSVGICEPRQPQATAEGFVGVLPVNLYMVPESVGMGTTVIYHQDVAAVTYSGYNLNARHCLPIGWEQCVLKDTKAPSLAGAEKMPLSLSGVVSLARRFCNTV